VESGPALNHETKLKSLSAQLTSTHLALRATIQGWAVAGIKTWVREGSHERVLGCTFGKRLRTMGERGSLWEEKQIREDQFLL